MDSLHNKLCSLGRWVETVAVLKAERGHFRASVLVGGVGGKKRYEARAATPVMALSDCMDKVREDVDSAD